MSERRERPSQNRRRPDGGTVGADRRPAGTDRPDATHRTEVPR